MTAQLSRSARGWGVPVRHMILAGLCLLVAGASLRPVVEPLAEAMPHMAHYLAADSLALWGHILAGPLALALLPVQMSSRLRARAPWLHRGSGYLALTAILVAALAALALLPRFQGSPFAASGFAAMALCWLGFAALGFLAARRGDYATHRRYMLRASVLTFGAVLLRLMMAPLIAAGWSVTETYQITAWGCWLPALVGLEFWLRRGRNAKGRP